MSASPRTRLHVGSRSIVLAVAMLAATVAGLALVAASTRVLGWIVVAATLAAVLHPVVGMLDRRMPRGLALALVVIATVGLAAFIGWRVVDDVGEQLRELQRDLPRAARSIERSERFGEAATEAQLAARVETFVRELPERLRGGDVDDALRAAATRGVAFLATGVLTIFFLIHGPRLLGAAARQLPPARRERAGVIAVAAYHRAWRYLTGSMAMAAMAGLLAFACARLLDLPGRAPLAVWMALVDLIPLLGVVLGAAPLILLAAATSPAWQTVAVAAVLLGWQVFEALVLHPAVERRSLHVGPFVTVAVAMVGLELYGIGGAIIGFVAAVAALAVADEVAGEAEVASEA
ncbi:MAG TPA: AI-2E family transporter [Acidimicrobiales bacterium]|nr:AI-2E family transporter [Acidimicrobiales bacterium]